MTDFCQTVSLSRPSGTLGVSLFCHRTLALPESPLDFLSVLLRFSLFEAAKNQSYISIKLEPQANPHTMKKYYLLAAVFAALLLATGCQKDPKDYIAAELVDGQTFNAAIPKEAQAVVFIYNSSVSSGTVLSTSDSPVPIYGNLVGTTWRVSTSADMINANPDCSWMFKTIIHDYTSYGYGEVPEPSLIEIDFGVRFNTENVTNMSSMFYDCIRLTRIDLSNFNTENVTNMSSMFSGCSRLASVVLSNFNTKNVSDMSYMFSGCFAITSLGLSCFNTKNVTGMDFMFNGCISLTSLNLSSFNTVNVTNMHGMFAACNSLTNLDISHFNTVNVTNMHGMFGDCNSLTDLDLSHFNTENVTTMNGMFYHCSSLTSLDISQFNTENVTDMRWMFDNCSSLTSLDLSHFNTENVTDMRSMFYYCSRLESLDLSNFNTKNVTNMQLMFKECRRLTSLDLSHFDMSSVEVKWEMCGNLSTTSRRCTITCLATVQTALQSGDTHFPTSGVSFTWVRPTTK